MNSPEKENLTEKSTCESCGKVFDCGAKTGNCWCFDIDLSQKTLDNLRDSFAKCLCQDCLLSHEQTRKDTKI